MANLFNKKRNNKNQKMIFILSFMMVLTLCVGSSVPARQASASKVKSIVKKANKSYKNYIKGKKGYYKIITLKGSRVPVLLMSKTREKDTKGVYNCKVYKYSKGKVKKAGAVRCSTTSQYISLKNKYLEYGGHHYAGLVTVRNGKLNGYYYSERSKKNSDKTTFYRQKIKNGKKLKKVKISRKTGMKYIYDDGLKEIKFKKIV